MSKWFAIAVSVPDTLPASAPTPEMTVSDELARTPCVQEEKKTLVKATLPQELYSLSLKARVLVTVDIFVV